jgi:hypothetical protein
MGMVIRVRAWVGAMGLGLAASCGGHAADAPKAAPPVPAEDFIRQPKFVLAKISPDGNYIATTLPNGDLTTLGVIDLKNFSPAAASRFRVARSPPTSGGSATGW